MELLPEIATIRERSTRIYVSRGISANNVRAADDRAILKTSRGSKQLSIPGVVIEIGAAGRGLNK